MDVIGCMRCGSKRVSPKRLIDGPVVFEHEPLGTVKCLDCGYESIPLIFKNERDRKRFEKSKRSMYDRSD
jgi:hypothetical protein